MSLQHQSLNNSDSVVRISKSQRSSRGGAGRDNIILNDSRKLDDSFDQKSDRRGQLSSIADPSNSVSGSGQQILVCGTSETEACDVWEDEPVLSSKLRRSRRSHSRSINSSTTKVRAIDVSSIAYGLPAGSIDPFEKPSRMSDENIAFADDSGIPLSTSGDDAAFPGGERIPVIATSIASNEMSTRMSQHDEPDMAQLKLLAGQLSTDWKDKDFMAPALARRIRDFQFAQEKRRRKYGDERPWGILGVYEHLSSIRFDVEWAEDSDWRRANGEPYLPWADFDESKKKGINRRFFTLFLLFTCTIFFIVSIALNGWNVEPLKVNPMIGPSAQTLLQMGAKDSYLIVHGGEAWRLGSSILLHAGLVHYFINMLALWFVGSAIEISHGFVSATFLFVLPAIGGNMLSAIFLPDYVTVGSSGGIFGLIGACLADITMNWKLLFCNVVNKDGRKMKHAMVVVFLVLDIVLNMIIGLTPFVDNFTHLGGMVIGFLCGLSTMERLSSEFFGVEQSFLSRTKEIVVKYFGLIVSVILIIVAAIVLSEGDGQTTPCPDCTWLSCVPFPPWEGPQNKWWYCDDCGRVVADIVPTPNLHLEMQCPDGTSVAVALDPGEAANRSELEKNLPSYCREYFPST